MSIGISQLWHSISPSASLWRYDGSGTVYGSRQQNSRTSRNDAWRAEGHYGCAAFLPDVSVLLVWHKMPTFRYRLYCGDFLGSTRKATSVAAQPRTADSVYMRIWRACPTRHSGTARNTAHAGCPSQTYSHGMRAML